MTEEKKEKVRFCSLWQNTTKNGVAFFSGSLLFDTQEPIKAGTQMTIWPNSFKKGPKDPDFVAYLAPKREQTEPILGDIPSSFENMTFPPNIPF